MRPPYQVPIWKTAPLIRLLLPLMAGIMLQWYLHFSRFFMGLCLSSFVVAFFLLYFLRGSIAFYLRHFRGLLLHLIVVALGLLLTWQTDVRHRRNWYGHYLRDSAVLVVTINEPLLERAKSYKAEAAVTHVIIGKEVQRTSGKILLYFAKDTAVPDIRYGQVIILNKMPQPIRNAGNPAAFDYKRYAAFQQIHHQLFLKSSHWQPVGDGRPQPFRLWLFESRSWVLGILHKYIGDQHHELGIAEALLIGYKEDLDKTLVQAYSNTGVVHIIAISGLHLGLIFFVLTWTFNRVPGLKKSRHVKVVLLLSCLWLFSMLTGGSASVLRSAVMFTVIVIGRYYFKQSSVYSSLSASAFLLLCYDPYYLWDVGFQLSYLAVIGIVALQQPLYRLLYFKNRLIRNLWNMVTITVAAQVATFPVCLYYFHQFPNLFLFTNLLTVPLSTIILFAEILLIIISPITLLAQAVGWLTTNMIMGMNYIILFFDGLPFGIIGQIYADLITTCLLYAVVFCFCIWLLRGSKTFLRASLIFLGGFSGVHAVANINAQQQHKIIIYNVPKYRAVDFIAEGSFAFVGDSALQQDEALKNFNLRSSRISYHASKAAAQLPGLKNNGFYWQFYGKKLVFMDSTSVIGVGDTAITIDILLLSYNTPIRMADARLRIKPAIIVFDASNSSWQIEKWKKECDELNLRFHSVSERGAFTMEVGD